MAGKRTKRAPAWQTAKSPLNLYRDDLRESLGRSGRTLAAMRRAVINTVPASSISTVPRSRSGPTCTWGAPTSSLTRAARFTTSTR